MAEHPESSGFEATIAVASAEGVALLQQPGPSTSAAPGSRVDRYLIVDELGRGAMGVVYAAYDPQLDRKVAIKVISVDALGGRGEARAEAQARLLREAQAMARLLHPNVVAVHDVGSTEREVFIAMEMVVGQTLRGWLAERQRSVAAILEVFIAAGRGLQAAHEAGLVHRDFKPDNVLLDRSGAVKIADFGLARRADDDAPAPPRDERAPTLDLAGVASSAQLTRTGTILGTPAYMAPEQHLSLAADARSDQFAFCVALYEALHGRRPFTGETLVELRARVLRGAIEPAPAGAEVPRWILPIVARGLAVDPAARWPSIGALIDRLGRDPRRARRRWLAVGGLGVALSAAIAGGLHLQDVRTAAALADCQAPEQGARELLAPARREAMRRSVLGTEAPHAERSLAVIEGAIERFTGRWIALHAQSCEASQIRRTLAPELMALRERCAERQLQAVRATVDVLIDADATVVEHIGRLADRMPRPERCDDLKVLVQLASGAGERDEDPQVKAIQNQLTRAYAEANSGRYVEADERVTALLGEAEALGDRRLLAEIRESAGRIRGDMGDLDGSEAHLLAGLGDALATDYVLTGAEIANQLMYLEGVLRGHVAPARRWGAVAAGLIDRTDDDDVRLQHLNYLGALHAQSGDYAEGLKIYDEAVEIADRLGIERQDRASLLNNRGILLGYAGRRDEAIASHEEALAILRHLVGDDHPDVALTLNGLGLVHHLGGDLEVAITRYGEAGAILERLLGPESPVLVLTLLNLGNAELEARRLADARVHSARALALAEAHYPADHIYFGYLSTLIGELALRSDGDLAAAEARCDRGLELLEANLGPTHPNIGYPLLCLGDLKIARGELVAARPLLERAIAVHGDAHDVAVADRGHARFALARALAGAPGADLTRARALTEAAIGYWAAAGPAYADRRAEAEAWLAGLDAAADAGG